MSGIDWTKPLEFVRGSLWDDCDIVAVFPMNRNDGYPYFIVIRHNGGGCSTCALKADGTNGSGVRVRNVPERVTIPDFWVSCSKEPCVPHVHMSEALAKARAKEINGVYRHYPECEVERGVEQ